MKEIPQGRFFIKNTHSAQRKIAKMIGVTLRYKWITWAMFVGLGLEPVLPSGRLSCLAPSRLIGW